MLELKNITHQFHKDEPVLQQVSLQVAEGEFVAVIGRSGAGKTTLLKLFNGMVTPQQGTVWVDGECLSHCSGKKLRQIQSPVDGIGKRAARGAVPESALARHDGLLFGTGPGKCESGLGQSRTG